MVVDLYNILRHTNKVKILNEMDGSKKVSVLVNGLGSTPLMELYIMYRKVHEILGKNNSVIF